MGEKENDKTVQTKKALTSRGILLLGIAGLLVVLLIVGAVAWYTRITATSQLTMDAAQFDFKVSYAGGDYIIQADDYINIYGDNHVAPGTIGVIPVRVDAGTSEVDVDYVLNIDKSNMDDEFKRRIRFFYIPNGKEYSIANEVTLDSNNPIKGTLAGSKSGTGEFNVEFIYWEWVYDLNDSLFYSPAEDKWYIKGETGITDTQRKNKFKELYPNAQTAKDEVDKMDTDISLGVYDDTFPRTGGGEPYASASQVLYKVYPDGTYHKEDDALVKAYQKAMESKFDISGAQATPIYQKNHEGSQEGAGDYGTKYEPLENVIKVHNSIYSTSS